MNRVADVEVDKVSRSEVVTTTTNGLMLSTDKVKLNGIEEQANKTIVDGSLSGSSSNPVKNSVIHAKIQEIETHINEITSSGGITQSDIYPLIWGTGGFRTLQEQETDPILKNMKLGDYIYHYLGEKYYTKTEIDQKIATTQQLQQQTLGLL